MFTIFLNVNKFVNQLEKGKEKKDVEDEWVLSKFYSLESEVKELYEKYLFPEIVQKIG